ncbi:MAG TPA: nickel pincer cofactor biosynthesis protein LarB [Candidatus Methanoperedenaceae archaeon]|nr:nickel pincer cofactor biosynthesis protein LarB [Candidatus Methanoperedenaceae archaeon]
MALKDILERLRKGELDVEECEKQIRLTEFMKLSDMAKIDTCRELRVGIPEVIFAEGKTVEDIVSISKAQLESEGRAIATRASDVQKQALEGLAAIKSGEFSWNERARVAVIRKVKVSKTGGRVGIVSAGNADIPVAEEAAITAQEMGCEVFRIYDVGVAGIHRLFPELQKLMGNGVDAIVVAAGREGALPTVVSGLVDVPVIGLPVSSGYGAGGRGEAALLTMLQSCSVIAVVNIDAGFVAGAFAGKIANAVAKSRCK